MKRMVTILALLASFSVFGALTATKDYGDVFGSKQMQTWSLTFTSVTGGAVSTGLNDVIFAAYSPSTSDDHGIVYLDYSDAGSTVDPRVAACKWVRGLKFNTLNWRQKNI